MASIKTADVVALAQRLWNSVPERKVEAQGVLNGFFGDHLARAGSTLAIEPVLCFGPALAPLEPPFEALAGEGARACVFVHGLMGTERAWAFSTGGGPPVDYGQVIAEARGATPIFARFNTGQHISTNGKQLAGLLESMVEAWPGLEEISIVAHSMGGLVTRSAIHYGQEAGHRWVTQLRRVFLLGVPSHGAPLEQLVHVAAFTLESIWNPWTKAIAKVMNLRSAGIKDLRHGFVLDEDWRNRDPDVLALRRPRPASMPEHVRWFVAVGALGEAKGRLSWLLGDGLVHPRSGTGKGLGTPRQGLLPDAERRLFDSTSHVALMNDPRVLTQILEWWTQ